MNCEGEAIKNYYDEREAVMSLISDGLQKQLDVLQDIVDKTKEAMDRTSDLRDYQNNVEEATKNISSLEKQLAVVPVKQILAGTRKIPDNIFLYNGFPVLISFVNKLSQIT